MSTEQQIEWHTPWRIKDRGGRRQLEDADGWPIGEVRVPSNYESHILKACNLHERLVETVQELMNVIERAGCDECGGYADRDCEEYCEAQSLLAEAAK